MNSKHNDGNTKYISIHTKFSVCIQHVKYSAYVCSTQFGNLRNLKIAIHNFEYPKMHANLKDCVKHVRSLEIVHMYTHARNSVTLQA